MLEKVTVLLLVSVSYSVNVGASDGEHYGVLAQFQKLAASTALMLPTLNVSSDCLQQSHFVMQEAERMNFWALKILDATAKVPAGILNGNLNQLGDYDLCLESIDYKVEHIQGRYCVADFSIIPKDKSLKEIDDRMHNYRPLTSEVNDHAQRLPKLSTWRWGVCIPVACSSQDLTVHLKEHLSRSLAHRAHVDVQVDPDACYTAKKASLNFGHYFTISLVLLVVTCVAWATIQEKLNSDKSSLRYQIFESFSLQRNWEKLISTESSGDDIDIVNGAKALNALALCLAHKQMAYLYSPFTNGKETGTYMSGTWTMIARSSYIYTDSFILLSGLLVAHSTVKELDKTGKINFGRNLLFRYIRFTPNLLFVILANTYLADLIGSGPLWGFVVDKYSNLCKNYMWRNLLYVQNYYGWENICLTNTHQLAIDMQLYLISPIVIYFLWKSPKLGLLFSLIISVISSWLRYTVAIEKETNFVVHYGASIKQLFTTGSQSYSIPTHRATVYCIGILFGFALRRGYTRLNISNWVATIGWSAAVAAAVVAVFGPSDMANRGYVYDSHQAAYNNTIAPILWSFFLVWCGLACWNDQGGWMNSLLSWKYFKVFSRISYAFYLVQFPIYFYNVGTLRTSQTFHGLAIIDIKELSVVFAAATVLTLVIEMPCQNLKRIMFPVNESKPKAVVMKDKNANNTEGEYYINQR